MPLSISINQAAAFNVEIAIPGPQGPAGPQGPQGQPGQPGTPGVGVPAGGTVGQVLTKASGVSYDTSWTTLSFAGYATEAWVISQGYITSAALTPYLTSSVAEATYQTLAGMSSYLTISAAASGYYPLTGNPAGFLTSASLAGYATESWVTSQGYITASALTPYLLSSTAATTFAPIAAGLPTGGTTGQVLTKNSSSNWDDSWQTLIPGDRYLTTSTTSNTISNGAKTFTVQTGLSYSSQQDVVISFDAANHMHARVTSYNSGTGVLVVDVQNHTGSGTYASWTINVGGMVPAASVAWGSVTGIIGNQADLAASLNAKANLSGATFTGKANFTPVSGVAGLNVGIGGTSAASTTNGDIWISTGGTNLNFRDGTGSWRILVNTSNTNTFSASQIIDTTSATAALRVTQKGTGNAIEVEDSTTPDSTRFVVDQFGKVGIGIAPDATAALKVDTNGIMFGNGSVQTVAANPFTGGAITSPITYAGSTYSSEIGSDQIKVTQNASSNQSYQAATGFYTAYVQTLSGGGTTLRQVFLDNTGFSNVQEYSSSLGGHNVYITPTVFSSVVLIPGSGEQSEAFEITKNGIYARRINPSTGSFQAIQFNHDGITFGDGTYQTTAYTGGIPSGVATESWVGANYYPLSNPSGFIDSSTASSSFYPLSGNPSGFMSSPGSGSYVWYSGGWYSANLSTVFDSSSNYINVLSF